MNTALSSIKKMVKIHTETAEYYHRCGVITTEIDLIDLFQSLSEQRKQMAHLLLSAMTEETRKGFFRVQESLSFIQRAWYNMKLALIINDRSKILHYCHKTELDMLAEYKHISEMEDLPEDIFRYIVAHQQRLKESIERINNTSRMKYYLQNAVRGVRG